MTDTQSLLVFIFLIWPILLQIGVIIKSKEYFDRKDWIYWLIPYSIYHQLGIFLLESVSKRGDSNRF